MLARKPSNNVQPSCDRRQQCCLKEQAGQVAAAAGVHHSRHWVGLVRSWSGLDGSVMKPVGQGTHALCFFRPALYVLGGHSVAVGRSPSALMLYENPGSWTVGAERSQAVQEG